MSESAVPGGSLLHALGSDRLPHSVDVVVVGGGITGAATAFHLAEEGCDVVLLEQHDVNTQASGRNAGSLHGQIQYAPFVARGEAWANAFVPALQFLADSVQQWVVLSDLLGAELEVTTNGGLLVAETDDQMRYVEDKVAIERAAGFPSEVLGRDDLRRLAPYVSRTMVGAGFSKIEGKANPLLATPAFVAAAERLGARIFTNVHVRSIDQTAGGLEVHSSHGSIACTQVVLAAGSGIAGFESLLGARLPIHDEPIQLSVTEPVAHFVDHLVYFAGGALTFKQARAGSILIGGGWPASHDPFSGRIEVDARSLRSNLRVAERVVPRIGGVRVIRAWTGVARNTPDLLPIIGRLGPGERVVVGVFPHMGFTAGPMMGRTLADLVLDRVDRDLAPFTPHRF